MVNNQIKLARLSAADILRLKPVFQDEQVVRPSHLQLPENPLALDWALETLAANHHCFGIYLGTHQRLVGMIAADPSLDDDGKAIPHSLTISYLLNRTEWGQHVMTEAVRLFCRSINPEDQRLVIVAEVLRINQRSMRVLQNANFKMTAASDDQITFWKWSRRVNRQKGLAADLALRV